MYQRILIAVLVLVAFSITYPSTAYAQPCPGLCTFSTNVCADPGPDLGLFFTADSPVCIQLGNANANAFRIKVAVANFGCVAALQTKTSLQLIKNGVPCNNIPSSLKTTAPLQPFPIGGIVELSGVVTCGNVTPDHCRVVFDFLGTECECNEDNFFDIPIS